MYRTNTDALNSAFQHTLARATPVILGTTLRGIPAEVTLRPAPDGHGGFARISHRGELRGHVAIKPENTRTGESWTELVDLKTGLGLGVVEHLFGAIVLAGLDINTLIIEVNYPGAYPRRFRKVGGPLYWGRENVTSLPLMDGTATTFLQAIHQAGIQQLPYPRRWLQPKEEAVTFVHKRGSIIFRPRKEPGFSIHAFHTFEYTEGLVGERTWDSTDPVETADIGCARAGSNVWLTSRLTTWGTQRPIDFAVVYGWRGIPLDGQEDQYPEEAIRHKMFDTLGDLFPFLGHIQANIELCQVNHDTVNAFRHQWQGDYRNKFRSNISGIIG